MSTQLFRWFFFTSVDGCIMGPTGLGSLLSVFGFFSPILDLCNVECLTLCRAKLMRAFWSSVVWHLFLLLLHSSLPIHSEVFLPQTQTHMCFFLVWLYGSFFIPVAFVVCHRFVLIHLYAFFNVVTTAFGFGSQAHPTALHMLSTIISDREGSFIFVLSVLAAPAVRQYPVIFSSSLFKI